MNEDKLFAKLSSIDESLIRLTPRNSFYMSGTDPFTGRSFRSILVNTTAVFNAITGTDSNGDSVDYVSLWGISAASLAAGTRFYTPGGWVINTVDLTSGTAIGFE